ncbi:MAG: aminopeptidase P N-terminal domain-containing protein [Planctomycetota bacterium]
MNAHRTAPRALPIVLAAALLTASGLASLQDTAKRSALPAQLERCGLGKSFHAGRRAALCEKLKTGVLVVRGMPETRDYARFEQDKTFWYLTGIDSPNATIVVDVASKKEMLFLPKANAMLESWDGEMMDASDAWVRDVTGIADVRAASELVDVLKELAAKASPVWISKHPHVQLGGCFDRAGPHDSRIKNDPLDGRLSREAAFESKLKELLKIDVKDCAPMLTELRRIKTPEEIDAMRRASQVGAAAMSEAIRSTQPGLGEWQIEAVMSFVHRREGAEGAAYQAIVGSGPNALVLHYSAVSRTMKDGEMLLIDYAPELDHYTSDITRSWPIGGKFTPKMAEIYDAVLAAQEAGIAAVKPGAKIADVDRACRKVLEERGMGHLMPHGACHYIGMEVHDVGGMSKPLEPGVTFTVEPGVYDPETNIGVRIEDVVLVTADGCEVLSRDVVKTRPEIEALWSEEGILESKRGAPLPKSKPLESEGARPMPSRGD